MGCLSTSDLGLACDACGALGRLGPPVVGVEAALVGEGRRSHRVSNQSGEDSWRQRQWSWESSTHR